MRSTSAELATRAPREPGISRTLRVALVVMETFVAVGAVYGGLMLLVDAEGLGVQVAWLDGSPFADYMVPGVVLLIVIGGGMAFAAVLTLCRSVWAPLAAIVAGVVLLIFLAVETAVLGWHGSAQAPLLGLCGLSGLALVILGARAISEDPHS